MSDPISCPYCNAVVPADGARLTAAPTCPRCGELLPAHLAQSIQTQPATGALSAGAMPPTAQLALRPTRPSLRRVAGIVVGIMGVMAILGFTYAWHTVSWRRSRDPRPPRPVATLRATIPKPIEWAALGYLPPETAIIAGLHVAEAEKTPRGKEFLQGGRIGNLPISPTDLESWTGLKISEIDHAVFGLKLEPRLIPALVLVAQARQPIDQGKVRAALKAERSSDIGKKKVWHFNLRISSKLALEGQLWFASPDTLIVSLSKLEMEKMPDQPVTGATQLPPTLRDTIKDRIAPGAHVWLAGHVETWDGVMPLLSLVVDKQNLDTLASLRTFAIQVGLANGIRLQGAVRGVDDAANARLDDRWGEMIVPESSKELAPLFRELAKSYRHEIKDGWWLFNAEANEQP